jgi:hypothetical protein
MINLHNCVFGFKCTANWDEMIRTNNDAIRHCDACDKKVYFVTKPKEMMKAIKLNRCVAVFDESFERITSGKMIVSMESD